MIAMNIDKSILREVKLKSGEMLTLRKPCVEDAKNMIDYLNTIGGESDNLLFGKGEFRLNGEQEAEYIRNSLTDENGLMILGIIDGSIVSISTINSLGRKRIAHYSDLSISVKKDYWRKGIGSAVMEELIRFAAENKTIQYISLGVRAENTHAIHLYEKYGFRKVGCHKNYFNINGCYYDEILMDLDLTQRP
jgi:ribosomal protein S18 acetylase RimI-like enzyme